ncbi:MAG: GIY-YIG nuclease family protein [Bacteroidota bacterium]
MAKKKRRGLIKGNLERISSRVFDLYHDEITELVGKHHGVYALYKKNRLYYVGLANNLKSRVKHHLRDRHAKKWDAFSLYLIRNVNYLRELESLLVHIAEPTGNIMRGRFTKSVNLLKTLEEMMEERDKKQRETILAGAREKRKKKKHSRKSPKKIGERKKGVPVLKGMVKENTVLKAKFKGKEYSAEVDQDGKIHLDGKVFNSPSMAAQHITVGGKDGWIFWKYQDNAGEWVTIDALRKR